MSLPADPFPECPEAFRLVCEAASTVFTGSELEKWVDCGRQIKARFPTRVNLLQAFFEASPAFFRESSCGSLDGWVSEALRIGEISTDAARRFMERTPAFIASSGALHLREWAGMLREILAADPAAEEVALSFLDSGLRLLQQVTYRIFRGWHDAGMRLLRRSPAMAGQYFASVPDQLLRLYQTEMRKVFELTAAIGRELPGKAVEFYHAAPGKLLRLNPNVRERVLDITVTLSRKEPAAMQKLFDRVADGLAPLSYPDQETVIRHEAEIAALSGAAAAVYFDRAAALLRSVEPLFFHIWVAEGCRLLSESEQVGLAYLSGNSIRAQADFCHWQKAVFLDKHEKLLSAYARALCGEAIYLKPSAERGGDDLPGTDRLPEKEGTVLFLPAVVVSEESREDNFRVYKTAVAHSAGHIAFGTFGAGYDEIAKGFDAFSRPELIRKIFFVLENGRIDRCLRAEYRGLREDLDRVLDGQLRRRSLPGEDPLQLALECLLRLVFNRLPPADVPESCRELVERFRTALHSLYRPDAHVSSMFLQAVEIYHWLAPLLPDDPGRPIVMFDYLEMPDLDIRRAGQGDEVGEELQSGEETGGFGLELSAEELERLRELLQDIAVIEPIRKGAGGKGFLIEGLTARVAGELEELGDDDPRPEERIVVQGGLQPLATRVGPFYYDEWDYLQQAYRSRWCCLREVQVEPAGSSLYETIYSEYSRLIHEVKRQFQRIRPETLERVRRLEWGTEIDFNAMIQNVVDRKTGDTPSDRIFTRREKKRRHISTFLLIDMSASTDRLASSLAPDKGTGSSRPADEKRIIDIEIESLVVMAEALASLDDSYAIFGFSGYGREQVELFSIKDFSDPYSRETKNRICGIQPRKSTRMGPAIRHAAARLTEIESDYRLLLMLSDGYPQDLNYGEDRTSHTYALHDTMMALIEARRSGIRPFCITIDRCGDDYLKQMIDPGSYLVIDDIYSLPTVLPRVVESLLG